MATVKKKKGEMAMTKARDRMKQEALKLEAKRNGIIILFLLSILYTCNP